ncbi:flagellar attachment zone protein 1 [Scaptodrosophila lebanonensis]|uniref:Flagellar attachment zone protein 1 n=1 Tax=Drosophila lebanonensis TaxID=7225 RepID=A0A6J2UB38_DROLE|nr:flagellar attachment zone protein 1 [Scaptodrosophila lebanonensis]
MANQVFPELKVHINDFTKPTEQFLTKILIHYLRAFGFRVEPLFNIEAGASDTSREKRLFLIKLCRQIESILHISFPQRTFTYVDLITPSAKKIGSVLHALFNYLCFYKMFKKAVFASIEEPIKQHEGLLTAVAAKRRELDQRIKDSAQEKDDIAICQAAIIQLQAELDQAHVELRRQEKAVQQQNAVVSNNEEELSKLTHEVRQVEKLVVKDTEVQRIQEEIEKTTVCLENYKAGSLKQSQILKDRKEEMENIQKMHSEILAASELLPLALIADYKDSLKAMERLEKQYAAMEAENKQLQIKNDAEKQQLDQLDEELKLRRLQSDQDAKAVLGGLEKLKIDLQRKTAAADSLEKQYQELQEKIDEQQRLAQLMDQTLTELFGEN